MNGYGMSHGGLIFRPHCPWHHVNALHFRLRGFGVLKAELFNVVLGPTSLRHDCLVLPGKYQDILRLATQTRRDAHKGTGRR